MLDPPENHAKYIGSDDIWANQRFNNIYLTQRDTTFVSLPVCRQ